MITTLRMTPDFFMFLIIAASFPAFKMTHTRRAHTAILTVLFIMLALIANGG